MLKLNFFSSIVSVLLCITLGHTSASAANPHREFPSNVNYVENKNQWEDFIKYEADFRGGRMFLEANRFTYVFYHPDDIQSLHPHEGAQIDKVRLHATRVTPVGANQHPEITPFDPASHFNNYFIGKDPSKWASDVKLFSSVVYNNLYPGIDMKLYSSLNDIKYDFILKPGANANDINLDYDGVDKIFLKDGSLFIKLSVGDIVEEKPYAYQLINNEKKEVECNFKLTGNRLSFRFPKGYDESIPLVIDPTLIFSSFTGSTADNWGFTATYDAAGDLYSGGNVNNIGYPVTVGAFQQTYGGGGASGNGWSCDIAIVKFNPTGTSLLYATYLGGSDNDQPQSLIVDGNDELVIFGTTFSANFPVRATCYDTSINGSSDIFIAKLSTNGNNLLACTFIGGAAADGINTSPGFAIRGPLKYNYSDESRGEIITDANNDYIIGTTSMSLNFPTTPGTVQPVYRGGLQDGVVFKINSNLTGLVWSTFMGGNKEDAVFDCLLDPNGELYVSGGTNSLNFTTTAGALNTAYQGGIADGFLVHLNSNGSNIISSTYIGTTSYDQTFFVEMDRDGDIYCMGQTEGIYPVSSGVYSNFRGKQFIHKLTPDLSTTIYSTVFGNGSIYPNISPTAFLVDTCENVYVAGWGRCLSFGAFTNGNVSGMPVTPNAFQSTTNGCDFYFFVLSRDALVLSYATFFGGSMSAEHVDGGTSRFDKNGVIYEAVCAGCGGRSDFPTTPGVVSTTNNSLNCNNGVIKLALNLYQTESQITTAGSSGCIPFTMSFSNNSVNSVTYLWDFRDGTPTSNLPNPSHTFTTAGVYNVMLVVTNNNSCNRNDTSYVTIIANAPVNLPTTFTAIQTDPCAEFFANTQPALDSGLLYNWNFGDGFTTNLSNPSHLYSDSGTFQISLVVTDSLCPFNSDTLYNSVHFLSAAVNADVTANGSASGCEPLSVSFSNNSSTNGSHFWDFMDGSPIDTTFNPSHTFTSAGNYNVMFVVSDSLSCNQGDTSFINIIVLPVIPVITTFNSTINQLCSNPSGDFSFSGSGGNSFNWDFGDGTFGSGQNVSHTYAGPGTYQVTLSVDDTVCGAQGDTSQSITFYPPVSATVTTVGASSGCPPLNISFSNTSSNSGNHFWNFMDGSPIDTTFNPSHTFTVAGSYDVMFVVADSLSCNGADTAYTNINVLNAIPVVATFNSVLHPLCMNPSADFSFTGSGGNIYSWDFGDGNFGNGTNVSHAYSAAGNYTVTLTANDTVCGMNDTASQVISFYPPANAAIAVLGSNSGCPPLNVSFTNNSSVNGTHFWNFMDGSPIDTSFNPSHTFANLGTYQVMFVVTDPLSCNGADTAFVTIDVQVTVQVVATFNSTLHSLCVNPSADFVFNGTGGTVFSWDFGDGTFANGPNVSHTYGNFGSYQVTLTVNDPVCGSSGSTNQTVSFYPPVSASIASVGATSGCAPLNVAFTNSSSTNGNHFWNFMDGSAVDTNYNASHNFTIPGTYHVMFVVSDLLSCNTADTSFVDVDVFPSVPINAAFNSLLNPACTNPSADFSFSGSGGNTYSWDFGDGTFSSGLNVSHIYSNSGTFQVTLTVNDTVCSTNGTTSQSITFYPPATATIAVAGAASGCPPLNVSFSNNSTTGGNHFWNYMDGSPVDTTFNPNHIFANLGTYQVMFIVNDPLSCNGADTAYVNVDVVASQQVVASFNSTLHQLCTNPSADFSFNGVGGTTYSWDFGDGTFGNGPNVSHVYSGTGNYQVTLVVDDSVCVSNDSNNLSIVFYPPITASAAITGTSFGCPPLNIIFSNTSSTGNYSWNFMDGSAIDTSLNPAHTFTQAGVYDVALVVSNPNSCNVSDTDFVQVNVTPATPVQASIDLQVINYCDSLDATVTYNGSGGNVYSWNFGDGISGAGITNVHHYSLVGTYVITLYVNDSICNGSDSANVTVEVKPAIRAEINSDQHSGCVPQTISLSSIHSSPNYLWDFDDNTFAYVQNVVHDFNSPGQYFIKLIVSDSSSCNLFDTATYKFDVYEKPVADFSFVKNNQALFTDVAFLDQSSTNSVFYLWNFGDNVTDTTSGSVNHKYYNKGIYDVCLNVTTIDGCADSICRVVDIENAETIYIPSSFSPNGDGINDFFKVYYTGLTDIQVLIYNRWGEKIYEINTLEGGWNGTYKGEPAVQDVYIYKVIAKGLVSDSIERTGSVTLIY